ncbi:MAG: NUDIX domain-containing protein [Acidobacteria bacterium]|nr:NUDIX domain-containing protein [Acidobacteriota bacterium]
MSGQEPQRKPPVFGAPRSSPGPRPFPRFAWSIPSDKAHGSGSSARREADGSRSGQDCCSGGKLEVGESTRAAAVREVRERVSLELALADLELVGNLSDPIPTKPAWSQKSWAFRFIGEFGEPLPSDELSAGWFTFRDLPVVSTPRR